jgi:hypothetical protein
LDFAQYLVFKHALAKFIHIPVFTRYNEREVFWVDGESQIEPRRIHVQLPEKLERSVAALLKYHEGGVMYIGVGGQAVGAEGMTREDFFLLLENKVVTAEVSDNASFRNLQEYQLRRFSFHG